ncbi:MAG: GNAT family N-acetyltransferase [Kibdelosporangium sp.]
MIIRPARQPDVAGILLLAAEVEHWFGSMVDEPGFHLAVDEHIRRRTALVAVNGPEVLGALMFDATGPTYHVDWLVIAEQARGTGLGRALMTDAIHRFVHSPATIEVITFGADHPGAVESGARVFYERLGFIPGPPTDPGPEGGSRQIYTRTFTGNRRIFGA